MAGTPASFLRISGSIAMEKWKQEWRKIRAMNRRDAWWYIWEYYKIHMAFAAVILFFLVLILQANFGHRQETMLSVTLVDTGITRESAEELAAVYTKASGLDPATQKVSIDASLQVEGGTVANLQKLVMTVAAEEVDVLISDEDIIDYMLKGGALSDLQTVLPEDTLSRLSGRLVYVDADALKAWTEANRAGQAEEKILISAVKEGMTTPVPVGVDVTGFCGAVFDRPDEYGMLVFSVAVTTRRQEAAAAFLNYLEEQGGAAA